MSGRKRILCAGIAVVDQVFRIAAFPQRDRKSRAVEFASVIGGGAANAAIAIARLGGMAGFAGPLGGEGGADFVGDRIVAGLKAEGVRCEVVRVHGAASPVSAVLVDAEGGRTIVNHRDPKLFLARLDDPDRLIEKIDGVLVDDHWPDFVAPICAAARRRGLPVVLDVERACTVQGRLWGLAGHRIFSRAALTAVTGADDAAAGLARLGADGEAFLAVTDGANPIAWRAGESSGQMPVFPIEAVDTLAAGDVFHGAFALALLEAGDPVHALRFAAAAAALKCRRFGGGAAAPSRREVEAFLAAAAGADAV